MFCEFSLVWLNAKQVLESSGILYCLHPYSFKYEMLLFNRYVWVKLRPSNGYFERNMAKQLKVFFKSLKNHTLPFFLG